MKLLLTALGGLAFIASTASAATVDFHFGKDSQSQSGYWEKEIVQYEGGKTLTVTGLRCDDHKGPNHHSCGGVGYSLAEWDNGIGIQKRGSSDSHQVDGKYSNEFLKLTFDKVVELKSLAFSYFTDNDKFKLYTWTGSNWNYEGYGAGSSTYQLSGGYTSSMFLIGATGDHDAWKFKGVGVGHPNVVPLPAAGWLLLGGLGGLAAMKRRKKS